MWALPGESSSPLPLLSPSVMCSFIIRVPLSEESVYLRQLNGRNMEPGGP